MVYTNGKCHVFIIYLYFCGTQEASDHMGSFTIEVLFLGQRNQGLCSIGSQCFIMFYDYLVNGF